MSDRREGTTPVVIDLGSRTTKAGFAGAPSPAVELSTPRAEGAPRDPAEVEQLLRRAFDALGVPPDAQALVQTGSVDAAAPLAAQVRLAFEALGVPAYAVVPSAAAALEAAEVPAGVVVELGDLQAAATAIIARPLADTSEVARAVDAWLQADPSAERTAVSAWIRSLYPMFDGYWSSDRVSASPVDGTAPAGSGDGASSELQRSASLYTVPERHPINQLIFAIAEVLAPGIDRAGHALAELGYAKQVAEVRDVFAKISWREVSTRIADAALKRAAEHGMNFTQTAKEEIARDLVEKLSFVAEDLQAELKRAQSASDQPGNYQLPDGQIISAGDLRFRVPEVLFHPTLIGIEGAGLHQAVVQAVMKAAPRDRQALLDNIVLAGGATQLAGLAERLEREVAALAPAGARTRVVARPDRKYLSWIGAARLAASNAFMDRAAITRAGYERLPRAGLEPARSS